MNSANPVSFCKSWKTAAVVPILCVFPLTLHRKTAPTSGSWVIWPAADWMWRGAAGSSRGQRRPWPKKYPKHSHVYALFLMKTAKTLQTALLVSANWIFPPQNPASPVSRLVRYLICPEWKHLFNPSARILCASSTSCTHVVHTLPPRLIMLQPHPPAPTPRPHVVLSQRYVICQHKRRRCWMDCDYGSWQPQPNLILTHHPLQRLRIWCRCHMFCFFFIHFLALKQTIKPFF